MTWSAFVVDFWLLWERIDLDLSLDGVAGNVRVAKPRFSLLQLPWLDCHCHNRCIVKEPSIADLSHIPYIQSVWGEGTAPRVTSVVQTASWLWIYAHYELGEKQLLNKQVESMACVQLCKLKLSFLCLWPILGLSWLRSGSRLQITLHWEMALRSMESAFHCHFSRRCWYANCRGSFWSSRLYPLILSLQVMQLHKHYGWFTFRVVCMSLWHLEPWGETAPFPLFSRLKFFIPQRLKFWGLYTHESTSSYMNCTHSMTLQKVEGNELDQSVRSRLFKCHAFDTGENNNFDIGERRRSKGARAAESWFP